MKRPLLAFAALVFLFSSTATAAGNRYAVVTVNNNTRDLTFNFDYRWGNGKWNAVKELKAGRALWFAVPLDSQGKAPVFQLRLNRAIGNAKPRIKTFELQWKAAPKAVANLGRQYEIKRDLLERNYVWVSESGR